MTHTNRATESIPSDATMHFKGSNPAIRFGSTEGRSCLVKIYPPGAGEGLFYLPQRSVILGRGPECDLDLVDSAVSRQHAVIEPSAGNFKISDLGSTNGTFINETKIDQRLLTPGDLIRIGSHIIKFLSSDHIEAQYHETIYSMMISDALTGVNNKRYFMEVLERELVRSARHKRPLSLVMFDVDHFKATNDTFGHLAGDAVLREMCHRIAVTIRKDELFARYGGEEFGVLLPEATLVEARIFAERIRRLVADTPLLIGSFTIPITISVGIAQTVGNREVTPVQLISEADRALYQAKKLGRNRVCPP
ncbi:MAG: diguanylate cyclase [Planctomycetia bacterium]